MLAISQKYFRVSYLRMHKQCFATFVNTLNEFVG